MNLIAVVLPEEVGCLNFLFRGVDKAKYTSREDFTTFPCDDGYGYVDIISKDNHTVVLQGRNEVNLEIRKELMNNILEDKPDENGLGNFFSSHPLVGKLRSFQMLYVKESFYLVSNLKAEEEDLHFAKLSPGVTILRYSYIMCPFILIHILLQLQICRSLHIM